VLELVVTGAANDGCAGLRDLRQRKPLGRADDGHASPCGAATAMPTFALGKRSSASSETMSDHIQMQFNK